MADCQTRGVANLHSNFSGPYSQGGMHFRRDQHCSGFTHARYSYINAESVSTVFLQKSIYFIDAHGSPGILADVNLNAAVAQYLLEVAKPVDCQTRTYTDFDLAKLELCDAFLTATGLPTSPQSRAPVKRTTSKDRPTIAHGFVYLMKNNRNGSYKIGYSRNPGVRESTLQSEEPDITLIRHWPGTKIDEAVLHAKFATQRIRGEWFKLSDDQIANL